MASMLAPKKLTAEAIGAFTLIFVGPGSVMLLRGNAEVTYVGVALAHGLAIGLMAAALGSVSGGHFNPALTVAMWVTRRIETLPALTYVVAQCGGGILGALALMAFFPEGLRNAANYGTPSLAAGIDFARGVGIEAILTFFLVIVVLGTTVRGWTPQFSGMAMGMAITMGMLGAGRLTGAAMNPVRALAPATVSGVWSDHLVYWIGPIVGAVVAALLYHYVFTEERATA
jgi:MIP family channel proteins